MVIKWLRNQIIIMHFSNYTMLFFWASDVVLLTMTVNKLNEMGCGDTSVPFTSYLKYDFLNYLKKVETDNNLDENQGEQQRSTD